MSRQHDNTFVDVPGELYSEDYIEAFGTRYQRIDGYSSYFVSDDGDVISVVKEEPILLKTWENQHGHQYVGLTGDGCNKSKLSIHRLVAEAFIDNPEDYPVVRHLDDDPRNNNYKNLAWGTQKDNREDSVRNNTDFHKSVYCFETDRVYRTCTEAAKELGVYKSQITLCCKGTIGHAKGYHFCYADEINEKKNDKRWLRVRRHKPVVAIGPNGERLEFASRKEASKELGIPNCGISSVLSGHIKHTHGWIFEEGE